MRIARLETFLGNAGQRNYLFVRLLTDDGRTGIGEATLEWQERAVELLLNEWVASRVIGRDAFDIEQVIGDMVRDQYQGGATIMTAISAVEIAMWDLIGKGVGQPVWRLIGGQARRRMPAYANGWYGGCRSPSDFSRRARDVVARGYSALKFDPFTTAWKSLSREEEETAVETVRAVSDTVGPEIGLMIEIHGRLGATDAIRFIRRLDGLNIRWCEEPVEPSAVELLREVKQAVAPPISSGERLYCLPDFARLIGLRAADVVQMDVAHCGGIAMSKKIAAMAEVQDIAISPHCSTGPVALSAALHLAWSCRNMTILESFAEFDVPWRADFVGGSNLLKDGEYGLPENAGLGLDLDLDAVADHPYRALAFPSLWDVEWIEEFTGADRAEPEGKP